MLGLRFTPAFALLAGCAGSLVGQPPRLALSPAAAQQDFEVLRSALEEAHGGLYRFVAKPELDRRLDAHRARLDRPLSRMEFANIVSRAIAELRDGHARLTLDSLNASNLANARVLPLRLAVEDDRLVVRYNDSPTDTLLRPGMEVVSINGRTTEAIMRAVLPAISGDGFIETGKRWRLATTFPQLYWLFVEQTDTYGIVARDADGRLAETTLAGIVERERRSIENPVNAGLVANMARLDAPPDGGNVVLEFLEEPRLARLRVRSFGGEAFPTTLDNVFRVLRERGTAALILDLRGNGGGVDEYGALLLSYLVDRPFRYFDHIKVKTIDPSFTTWVPRTYASLRTGTRPDPAGGYLVTPARHPGVGEQRPAAQPFLGNLVVLIDGGSFSTTADVAAHLRSWRRAVFVGEETAGTYEGNTSGLNADVVLPNSGLRFRVMMYGYWNAVTPQRGGRGVIPEHVVPARIADWLRGSDRALEVARSLLR